MTWALVNFQLCIESKFSSEHDSIHGLTVYHANLDFIVLLESGQWCLAEGVRLIEGHRTHGSGA